VIAIDTNVVVRLIGRDDAAQAEVAEALVADHGVYLSLGVLMETEWVLRAVMGWPRPRVSEALSALIEVENIATESPDGVRWALERHAAGADLADMLHVVAAGPVGRLATFDRRIASDAGVAAPSGIVTL
jgi:predicted nucleic-acid-binding protein